MKLPARLTAMTGKQWRDGITYVVGVLGLAFETVVDDADKPTLIIAFVGMLGLPMFLRKDEKDAKAAAPPIPPAPPPADPPVLIPMPGSESP